MYLKFVAINFPEDRNSGNGNTVSNNGQQSTVGKLKQDLFSKNFATLEIMLRQGFSNSSNNLSTLKDAEGRPMLHLAVLSEPQSSSSPEENALKLAGVMQTLIRQGVSVETKDVRKRTALHVAAAVGNVAATEVLLANNADLFVADAGGMTPLSTASAHCQVI